MKTFLWILMLSVVMSASGFALDEGKYVLQNVTIETVTYDKDDTEKSKKTRTALVKIDSSNGRVWEWKDNWQEDMSSTDHVREWEELVDKKTAKTKA